ncbi:hypothetical protein ACQKPE_23305 [Pseudomonas sp. NPDC089554]|uniref:hypothetical protein n=1 Tax=Pseudomonas sp. NPDC089554 TaxID=3390653 RepID=UPI003D05415F
MDFYRGDDRNFFQSDIHENGFEPRYRRADRKEGYDLFEQFKSERPKAIDLKMFLQGSPQHGVVATSLATSGAYEGKGQLYKISIPDNELVALSLDKNLNVVKQVPLADLLDKDDFYLIYTGQSPQSSELVGFVHKGGVREATFFNPIPLRYIAGTMTQPRGSDKYVCLPVPQKDKQDWFKGLGKGPAPAPPR